MPTQPGDGKIPRLMFKSLMIQLIRGTVRWAWRAAVMTPLLLMALLRLVGSSAASGRARDEFYDLVPRESPHQDVLKTSKSDAFWSMYHQTYNPRLWRMRHLLTISAGRNATPADPEDEP